MPALANRSYIGHEPFLKIIDESLRVRGRVEFFLWLNGDLQQYLPNEIVVAGWGDFTSGPLHLDVISADPEVRGSHVDQSRLARLVRQLFARWVENSCSPYLLKSADSGFTLGDEDCSLDLGSGLESGLRRMRSAIVHGMGNERGRDQSLYVVFNSKRKMPRETRSFLEVLVPYMDASLRRISVPQEQTSTQEKRLVMGPVDPVETRLTRRETEIMKWVKKGKTNHEIAAILEISVFTVKNHLHRIFRKLDVLNRAQAVASMGEGTVG